MTNDEWEEWSNELATLIPEGDEAQFSNPEGAQEGIILDCLKVYTETRAELFALCDQWDAISKGESMTTRRIRAILNREA